MQKQWALRASSLLVWSLAMYDRVATRVGRGLHTRFT